MPSSSFSAPQSVLTLLDRMAGSGGKSRLITHLVIQAAQEKGFDVSEIVSRPSAPAAPFAVGDAVIWTYNTLKHGKPRAYLATVISVGPKLVTIDAKTREGVSRRAVPPSALKKREVS